MTRAASWLALLAVYAVAQLALGAGDRDLQSPRLVELVRDAVGEDGARLVLAAAAAGAFAAAAALARVWVPEPWATRAVLVAAVSPAGFALSASSAAPAAALLGAGTLLALRTRDHPTRARTLGGGACLALAPWFGTAFAAPAAVALAALVHWTYRRGRRLYAFLALECAGATAVVLAGVELSRATAPTRGAQGVLETIWFAPVTVLGAATLLLLARSRRERVSRAIPARRDAEVGAAVTALALLVLLAAAAIEPVAPEAGVPAAGALAAWAMRAFPRAAAVAAVATVGLSGGLAVALATGAADRWIAVGLF